MERVQKEQVRGGSTNSVHVAQGRFGRNVAQSDIASRIDNSPRMTAQRQKLQSMFGGAAQLQEAEEEMAQGKFDTAQRVEEEEPAQGKFDTAQLQEGDEEEPLQGRFVAQREADEEEPMQGKFDVAQLQDTEEEEALQGRFASGEASVQRQEEAQRPNNTGLPDNLKSGVESLSGMSMDNVKVHYNSSQPAQLNALAYTQGSDIHVAPGQERHLPHEAWHVVQQAQGRVQPTTQLMEGANHWGEVGIPRNVAFDFPIPDNKTHMTNHNKIAKTVQRKMVNPTGGSAATNDTVWLTSTKTESGHVFEVDLGTKNTKTELLTSIADKGKSVGQSTDVANAVSNKNWVNKSKNYNKPLVKQIDPFRMRTKGEYGQSIKYSQDYHFGPYNLGYVVAVSDQGSSAKMKPAYSSGSGTGVATNYSNIHEHTGNASIMTDAGYDQSKKTGNIKDSVKGWDANTKLTGEGARWNCVKDNISTITDETFFYTSQKGKNKIENPGIQFQDLWLTWSAEFDKKFGINNSDVIDKLKDKTHFRKLNGSVEIIKSTGKPQKIEIK